MGKLKSMQAKVMAKITTEIMSLEWTNKEKKLLAGAAGCTALVSSTANCYADADELTEKISAIVKDAYGVVFGISTGIAVLFAAWHLVCMMTSGDPQTTRGHMQAMKKIAAAWLVLNCLGIIMRTLAGLTTNSDYKF